MNIKEFFDPITYTVAYIIYDDEKKAAIIDPVLDYDPKSARITNTTADLYIKFLIDNNLSLEYIFETHAHADHLSSSQYLKSHYPNSKTAISENITKVQELFKGVFNFEDKNTDGSDFDLLLKEGQELTLGNMKIEVMQTPGHTPACISLLVDKKDLICGDVIFMEDSGTGRCDFPAGSAENLFHSVNEKLFKLSDNVRLYVGHDYQPKGRSLNFSTTVGEAKKSNIQISEKVSKEEFVEMRKTRDSKLSAPKLILPAVQFNVWGGKMPIDESNGTSYFKIPVNVL